MVWTCVEEQCSKWIVQWLKDAQVRTASLEENNDDDADNKVGWRRTIPWSDSFATMKKAKQFDNGNIFT